MRSLACAAQITGAIRQAARSTGTSFEYLLTTAQIEIEPQSRGAGRDLLGQGALSVHRPDLARHHEADRRGARLGQYADAIVQERRRPIRGAGPGDAQRHHEAAQRSDGERADGRRLCPQQCGAACQRIGRAPSEGELYIAHFLGPDGAGKLIGAAQTPAAGKRRRHVPAGRRRQSDHLLYKRPAQPRSVSDVYAKLTGRFEVARDLAFNAGLRGSVGATPDTAGVTQAFAAANAAPPVPDTRPLFQSMFTDRAQAMTQTVNELWTPPGADSERGAAAQSVQRRAQRPAQAVRVVSDAPARDPEKWAPVFGQDHAQSKSRR